jgi:hypothetical protein
MNPLDTSPLFNGNAAVALSPPIASPDGVTMQTQVDPRLAFLIRAAVRFDLVEAGELSLDEAFDGLVPAFQSIWGVAA